MKCDICGDDIGDNIGDWVAVDGGADICIPCAAREIAELRDAMRWRKWPEEKPEKSGRYLVLTDGSTDIGNHLSYWSRTVESWSTKDAGIAFWRPIGPLPGGA